MSEYEESPELQDLYSAGPQPVRERIAGMRKNHHVRLLLKVKQNEFVRGGRVESVMRIPL